MAEIAAEKGDRSKAISYLKRVALEPPVDWPLAIKKLALCFSLGEGVEAISSWKKLFRPTELSAPGLKNLESEIRKYTVPEFAYLLAQVHIAQGKYDRALEELKGLVSTKKETAEYTIALASVYERLSNYREASRLYEDALRLSPANQEVKRKVLEYYSGRQTQ